MDIGQLVKYDLQKEINVAVTKLAGFALDLGVFLSHFWR